MLISLSFISDTCTLSRNSTYETSDTKRENCIYFSSFKKPSILCAVNMLVRFKATVLGESLETLCNLLLAHLVYCTTFFWIEVFGNF